MTEVDLDGRLRIAVVLTGTERKPRLADPLSAWVARIATAALGAMSVATFPARALSHPESLSRVGRPRNSAFGPGAAARLRSPQPAPVILDRQGSSANAGRA
jgi:hypothetical protein